MTPMDCEGEKLERSLSSVSDFQFVRKFNLTKKFCLFRQDSCETLFYNVICDFVTCIGGGIYE